MTLAEAPEINDSTSYPIPVSECREGDMYWAGPDIPIWMLVFSDDDAHWLRKNAKTVRRLL